MYKLIFEKTFIKILVEKSGILIGVTTRSRAYFFFITAKYTGIRLGPTTDPYPGIVEMCDYDIEKILTMWRELYRYRASKPRVQHQKTFQRT
ncbi:MAG: hypothetical protein QW514_00400 [Thermoprotei archaeon]